MAKSKVKKPVKHSDEFNTEQMAEEFSEDLKRQMEKLLKDIEPAGKGK